MKHIQIILGLILFALVSTFAQSPRIKLNQITKDTVKGSVLISSPSDSGMVYSRDFYISYGADTVLILYGDTLAATSGIISSVLSDGVTITGDGTTGNELKVDTSTVISTIQGFLDTLTNRNYLTTNQTITLSGDVTGSGSTAITATVVDDSHNHIISNVDNLQDSLTAKANASELSNYVTIAGTETITGAKTFTANTVFDDSTLVVDATNNRVGIGTASPSARIEVNRLNNTDPFVKFKGIDDTIISQIYPNGVQEWNLTDNGGQITYATPGSNTGLVLYNDSVSNDTRFDIVNTTDYFELRFSDDASPNGLYIKKGGNVGIGTDSPSYKLDLSGNQRVYTSGTAGLFLEPTTGTESPNIIFLTTANRYNIDNNNGTLRFFREDVGGGNGAVRMSITDGGNVGIGTSPSEKLDVNGNGRFRSIGSGASAGALHYTSTGVLTTNTSDVRLKTNLQPLENTLNKLLGINTYTFNWINETDRVDLGMVAQEVEQIFPNLVFTNSVDGYKGIHYDKFSSILTKAIQEQQAIIETQEQKITDLERIIQSLITRIENLENK